ncbi:OmpA family protein [Myroides sp. M-43]|uniref:OmpA family protein n=1 Tax=Myroides oncorhynchi TaxID=2893756 RepID=UPI001E4D42F5|nr:OmpA family protein [Myroides oncorhynchi]MCC9043763.1 OmpA family protein [Myroides oncorhynchi]
MKKLYLTTLGVALLSFVSVSAQKIEGRVFDKKTNTPITEGEVTFFNNTGERIATVYTLTDGTYSFEPKKISDIHKVSTAAKSYSKAEVVINQMDKGVIANFGLTASTGSTDRAYTSGMPNSSEQTSVTRASYDGSTLPSFYYDFNSSYLTPDNKASVDQIVAYMYNNRDARVRIHVYFDTRGNAKYDEWLSDRRADRVINYMIMKGIDPSRLLKWIETIGSNIAPKGMGSKGGAAESRRCDFDII